MNREQELPSLIVAIFASKGKTIPPTEFGKVGIPDVLDSPTEPGEHRCPVLWYWLLVENPDDNLMAILSVGNQLGFLCLAAQFSVSLLDRY